MILGPDLKKNAFNDLCLQLNTAHRICKFVANGERKILKSSTNGISNDLTVQTLKKKFNF